MKKTLTLLTIIGLLFTMVYAQATPQLQTDGRAYPQVSLERAAYYVDENGYVTLQTILRDSTGNLITLTNPMPVTMTGSSITVIPTEGYATMLDGRKVVASAGTAEALAAATDCKRVDITAEFNNTGVIVVGGTTVVADLATRRGVPLYAGSTYTVLIEDLADVYIDATVSTDGCTYTYYE